MQPPNSNEETVASKLRVSGVDTATRTAPNTPNASLPSVEMETGCHDTNLTACATPAMPSSAECDRVPKYHGRALPRSEARYAGHRATVAQAIAQPSVLHCVH